MVVFFYCHVSFPGCSSSHVAVTSWKFTNRHFLSSVREKLWTPFRECRNLSCLDQWHAEIAWQQQSPWHLDSMRVRSWVWSWRMGMWMVSRFVRGWVSWHLRLRGVITFLVIYIVFFSRNSLAGKSSEMFLFKLGGVFALVFFEQKTQLVGLGWLVVWDSTLRVPKKVTVPCTHTIS